MYDPSATPCYSYAEATRIMTFANLTCQVKILKQGLQRENHQRHKKVKENVLRLKIGAHLQ